MSLAMPELTKNYKNDWIKMRNPQFQSRSRIPVTHAHLSERRSGPAGRRQSAHSRSSDLVVHTEGSDYVMILTHLDVNFSFIFVLRFT